MSMGWWLYSYSHDEFHSLLGSQSSSAKDAVVDATTWDDWHENMEKVALVSAALVDSKKPYSLIPEADYNILDEAITLLFCPEGLADQLLVKPQSPYGISPNLVDELIKRCDEPGEGICLECFKNGRRLGGPGGDTNYFLMPPAEWSQLLIEARAAYLRDIPWSDENDKLEIKKLLITVLEDFPHDRSLFAVIS